MIPPRLDDADTVQTLNLAFLGTQATPETLSFLTDFVDLDDPAAVSALSAAYVASAEFQGSFAAESSEDLVRAVHFNLFDRNTDVDEVAFWTDALDTNAVAASELPWAIIDDARESDIEALDAKVAIANYATEATATGGYVPDSLTFQELRSNEELYADLAALDAEYDTLSVEQTGASLDDLPIYAATVGTGERDVLFITQQHGDEPIGTESAMYFIDFLAGDSELAQAIREELTVTVVPRVNPDGFARWEQEVGGVRGLIDPRVNNAGIDLNRTYDPAVPIDPDEAPEALAVQNLARSLDPDFIFDYHGQGNYRDEDGDLDTMSVLWPTNPDVDPEVREASQRAIVALEDAVDGLGYGQVTLYPGSDDPSIARNGFSLDGTPGVLVEQRFSQEMTALAEGLDLDYSALRSALAIEGFVSMQGIVAGLADDSLDALDPTVAEAIPDRSDSIDFAELYGDDRYVPEDSLLVA